MEVFKKNKIVIGTWPLSGAYGHVPLDQVHSTLEECAKLGFVEFDVAPNYGNGFMEFCLGNVFRNDNGVSINSKVGNPAFGEKTFDVEKLSESFYQSLERLGRDRIKTLFLHNPQEDQPQLESCIGFLNQLKNKEKIDLTGISISRRHKYNYKLFHGIDVIQNDVNILYQSPLRNPDLKRFEFHARSPLASGLLSGKIHQNQIFDNGDHRLGWLTGQRLMSILKRVRAVEQTTDIPLVSLAQKFVLQLEQIDKVIFGVKSVRHVRDLARTLMSEPLSEEILNILFDLYRTDFNLDNEKHLGY